MEAPEELINIFRFFATLKSLLIRPCLLMLHRNGDAEQGEGYQQRVLVRLPLLSNWRLWISSVLVVLDLTTTTMTRITWTTKTTWTMMKMMTVSALTVSAPNHTLGKREKRQNIQAHVIEQYIKYHNNS